ncbi:MAG: DNA topoisomerase 4 subunit A [Nitrospirota bacterium]|nr:DNA topoisomerase 4 subunit A [Nitrospirota bacterium]MDH5774183.1 DNA topoisomerase 4 subunit A [Nitrospirota bacterium]
MAKRPKTPASASSESPTTVIPVPLDDTTRQRYLNYALSVITSRALPDIRDGLKPVQRRILFSMFHNHRLTPDRPPIKSAKVVGSVIGEWHPHGDVAVYDAMARMAQPWSLRATLVDGHGNFGSQDGDRPAAYRYTEARLTPLALELLNELNKNTVDFQPNYDGKAEEPLVLPARYPNLLVNGATGIAVGMATNMPPHNLGEVIDAAIALIANRDASIADLMKSLKGPDFPTGGEILNSRNEIRAIYETGQGSIRLRGEYTVNTDAQGKSDILITSIPFAVDKATIVERIGELILTKKIPQLVDVRDESTTDVRIALECQKEADPHLAMAYLFKHTPLQNNFSVNMTCLIPVPGSSVSRPDCLNLKQMLEQFIDFRFATVTRRFTYDLQVLEKRIHILNGFKKIFDALDQVLRIIRASDGKADSAAKLQRQFDLDALQTEAILETPIYKLSRPEIQKMLDELRDKLRQAKDLNTLLASKKKLWDVVKQELEEVAKTFGDKRRTKIGRKQTEEVEFDPDAFRVKEDAVITISTDGWIRRVGIIKDLSKARVREGDRVMAILGGSTLEPIVFFSNYGSAYTIRIGDIPPARSGYGDPVQKLFKFKDGERIIGGWSFDPRMRFGASQSDASSSNGDQLALFNKKGKPQTPASLEALAVTTSGMGLRFDLSAVQEPSTRLGRKFCKLKEGEEVLGLEIITGPLKQTVVAVASAKGRALLCKAEEVAQLAGPGRGVIVMKLEPKDTIVGYTLLFSKNDQLVLVKDGGSTLPVSLRKYQVVGRGGKGHALVKRGRLTGMEVAELTIPIFQTE